MIRRCMLGCFILFFGRVFSQDASGEFYSSQYPAAISFLIADLKYNTEDGVKICEVQQGIISSFNQDKFLHDGKGIIPTNFYTRLTQFGLHGWTILRDINEREIRRLISQDLENWTAVKRVSELADDPLLKELSKGEVLDPASISNYQGLLFATPSSIKQFPAFYEQFPGLLVMDRPTFKYWADKYKMDLLFLENERLAKVKAEWKSYPKQYTQDLCKEVLQDMPGDIYVIKPRGEFKGRGVLIVTKDELDKTLREILLNPDKLKKHKDPDYRHWSEDRFDSFIVEKFYASDPVSSADGKGKQFDPTMRITFLLAYDNHTISLYYTGAYFKFPLKSLSDKGTLKEKHKSVGTNKVMCEPSPEVLEAVENQIREPLILLFQEMLKQS